MFHTGICTTMEWEYKSDQDPYVCILSREGRFMTGCKRKKQVLTTTKQSPYERILVSSNTLTKQMHPFHRRKTPNCRMLFYP